MDFDSLQPDAAPEQQPQAANTPNPSATPNPSQMKFDDLKSDEDKYGTTEQQLKAGAEGVSKGLIGSTLTGLAETKLLGVKPEDIAGREEENPIWSGVGQAAGFTAGLLTGTGEAALATKAGEAALGLTKLGESANIAAKIGSAAVKGAAEMAVMSGDDEVAKKLITNPDESAQQAIGHIGLSAALGGAGGAFVHGVAAPLWKATFGPKLGDTLSMLTNKLGGKAAEGAEESVSQRLSQETGVDLAKYPAVAAKINGDPLADQAFSKLSQTDTTHFGRKTQEQLAEATHDVGSKIAETLGHDPSYVENLENNVDKYTRGRNVADSLHKEISQVAKPINEAYEATNAQFKATPVSIENKRNIADDIAKRAISDGWYKSADDSQKTLMEKVLKKLPEQETAEDLKKFITNLRESHPYGSPTWQAAKDISNIIREGQERSIVEGIAAKGGSAEAGAQAVDAYKGLKSQYAGLMNTVDGLNEHLHVGKYYSPQSFLNNLKEMGTTNGEGVLNRLSGASKANTLDVLQQFPETLSQVRQYHVDNLLTGARNAEGGLDPRKFGKQFNKLSPQIKDLMADQSNQARLKSLGELMEKTNDATHNWSNTARTLDKQTHGMPSPLSLIATMMGHGVEGLMSYLGGLGLKEGGDAVRYGMLKFLSSEKPIDAIALKHTIQMADAVYKGESALNKAADSVFRTGSNAIKIPTSSELAHLDKLVAKNQDNPAELPQKMVEDGSAPHYQPDHHLAAVSTATRAVQYLQTLKPQEITLSPLQKPIPPSQMDVERYHRALAVAQNPNVVLQHIKNGTLQASDIKDLNAMYPALYPKMQQKVMQQVVQRHQDDDPVPYSTRLSLSLFMAQPLDSTMTPQAIQAAQPMPKAPPQQPQGGKPKGSPSKLGKSNSAYKTASQSAESDRNDRD